MHPRALFDDPGHFCRMALTPDIDIEPESAGLLHPAITILAVLVKEHPKLGDLPLLVTDQDCLQDRKIACITGATKLVRHHYLRWVD